VIDQIEQSGARIFALKEDNQLKTPHAVFRALIRTFLEHQIS